MFVKNTLYSITLPLLRTAMLMSRCQANKVSRGATFSGCGSWLINALERTPAAVETAAELHPVL